MSASTPSTNPAAAGANDESHEGGMVVGGDSAKKRILKSAAPATTADRGNRVSESKKRGVWLEPPETRKRILQKKNSEPAREHYGAAGTRDSQISPQPLKLTHGSHLSVHSGAFAMRSFGGTSGGDV